MSRVSVVTDSTHCLPPELIGELDIRVAPIILNIEGRSYRDAVDITPSEFYKLYKELKEIPTTSAVIPGDFIDIFRELGKSTDSIVCLPLSKTLSGSYNSAVQAREMVKTELPGISIEIIDTKTTTGALGFIVLETARAAQTGKSLAEVVQVAQDMIPRVKFVAALDTLRYLVKGGRAPKAAGLLGDLIQMKPIVGLINLTDEVEMVTKVRTKRKALAHMVEIAKQYIDPGKPAHVIVQYADNIEEGEMLRDMVASELDCEELYMTEFTPVMCCHTGPLIGLAFYS